jgi:antitoxin (DNA-binding transcriptional repressor) of toxin-antitoxin stability system
MINIIGLKNLRENMGEYVKKISKGQSFVVFKQSKPIFKISPINNDDQWEEIVDFTKIKKGGVSIDEILSRL